MRSRERYAARCYAALGDTCKSRYLHKINKIRTAAEKSGGTEPNSHYQVRAKVAALNKHFKQAEGALLEQGHVDEAIKMCAINRSAVLPASVDRSGLKLCCAPVQECERARVTCRKKKRLLALLIRCRYEELHQYDEAIRVAYSRNHPNAAEIASGYFQMLVKSGQEEKAGMLKEQAGEVDAAIDLYLKVRAPCTCRLGCATLTRSRAFCTGL